MTFWLKQNFNLAGRGVIVSIFMSICQMTMHMILVYRQGRRKITNIGGGGGS
jgi:hypothetical protein